MSRTWTYRDLELVETLARRVRLLTVGQIAAGWWPSDVALRTVRRRLRRLLAGRLLLRSIVNAHPPLPLTGPLASWSPDRPVPDFEAVSVKARRRWTEAAVPQEVYFASPLAANLLGSTAGSLPAINHRDHDLLLGQVYVFYRTKRSEEAARWIGEDCLPKAGFRIKDPDAFLLDAERRIERVIESAGRYSPEQVEWRDPRTNLIRICALPELIHLIAPPPIQRR